METKLPIVERSRHRWQLILPSFGIPLKFLSGKHGPCPMCGGSDRFRWDNREGMGGYFCSNCGSGDGFKLAMQKAGVSFRDVCDVIREKTPEDEAPAPTSPAIVTPEERKARLESIWRATEAVSDGDQVHRYLLSRGITQWPSNSFRIAKAFWHPETKQAMHAMVAKIASTEGRAINLHVTYLTPDGKRADCTPSKRVMSGKLVDGCAIRLGKAESIMGIAEGIETALAASILHTMPVWAAVNATMLAKWMPPDECTAVCIYGDNDANYTGQHKAYELAHKLAMIGYSVQVYIPNKTGSDWADKLAESIS